MQDAEVEELDGVTFLIGLSDNDTVKKKRKTMVKINIRFCKCFVKHFTK